MPLLIAASCPVILRLSSLKVLNEYSVAMVTIALGLPVELPIFRAADTCGNADGVAFGATPSCLTLRARQYCKCSL